MYAPNETFASTDSFETHIMSMLVHPGSVVQSSLHCQGLELQILIDFGKFKGVSGVGPYPHAPFKRFTGLTSSGNLLQVVSPTNHWSHFWAAGCVLVIDFLSVVDHELL